MRTVKGQITILMLLYALTVTTVILAFSFYLMYTFQRKTVVQSTEFNLSLVAGMLGQDMTDLTALALWCGTNEQVTDYLLATGNEKALSLIAYERVREEFYNNRAGKYLQRLIIVDNSQSRLLQAGNVPVSSEPLTVYTVGKVAAEGFHGWERIAESPYFSMFSSQVITYSCPVYHPRDRTPIGMVYLAVETSVITDKLKGYLMPEGPMPCITLGENRYRLEGGKFMMDEGQVEVESLGRGDAMSSSTEVANVRAGGERFTRVSLRVREGMHISQDVSSGGFIPNSGGWIGLLAAAVFLILFLAWYVTSSLDREISRPAAWLRRKVDEIAKGDFSQDASLETNNELGEVGRGVNRLAKEIVVLMENRVMDEKKKRDLEYRMLQSQVNPHFLYNTLNSIKWMATIQNASGIAEMATALSRLLKTIAKDPRREVPLKENMDLLNDYLVIQKYRYGGAIKVKYLIESDDLLNVMTPHFLLQPLVENAIFHGIEPKGMGEIEVSAKRCGKDVLIAVTDDGVGMSREAIRKALSGKADESANVRSVGVSNVDQRIKNAYGEGYGLEIESEEGQFTKMTARLPADGKEA
jgi:two-component system sensor histidine kinase YesM